jgi:hypothetical protein
VILIASAINTSISDPFSEANARLDRQGMNFDITREKQEAIDANEIP